MEINKKAKEYLKKIRTDRKEKLLGIAMDIGYFTKLRAEIDDAKLRQELEAERGKFKTNKKGVLSTFIGDKEKIQKLEAVINKAGELEIKVTNYKALYHDLCKYIDFIGGLDDETAKRINEVHDKFGD